MKSEKTKPKGRYLAVSGRTLLSDENSDTYISQYKIYDSQQDKLIYVSEQIDGTQMFAAYIGIIQAIQYLVEINSLSTPIYCNQNPSFVLLAREYCSTWKQLDEKSSNLLQDSENWLTTITSNELQLLHWNKKHFGKIPSNKQTLL